MNYFLIDGRYDDLLRHYGLDPQAVLRQAELPADTLNHDRITMKEEQYYRFMQAIDELNGGKDGDGRPDRDFFTTDFCRLLQS